MVDRELKNLTTKAVSKSTHRTPNTTTTMVDKVGTMRTGVVLGWKKIRNIKIKIKMKKTSARNSPIFLGFAKFYLFVWDSLQVVAFNQVVLSVPLI